MKIALIIPLHNQAKYWERIAKAIKAQSRIPDNVYVVIDRPHLDQMPNCIDHVKNISETLLTNIKVICIDKPPKYIKRNHDNLFLAGYARNIALEHAIKDQNECFIFIDGDCVPQRDLVKSHELMCSYNIPMLSVGRRRESQYRGMDQREYVPTLVHYNIFKQKGLLINNPDLIKQCLIVWSCNIALNLNAINIIKNFNKKYYNRDELFNSDFNGAWGGEDSFLGVVAWYCRIFIHTIEEPKSGVEHIDHPRPTSIYNIEHKYFFEDKFNNLKKLISINPIDINIFNGICERNPLNL